MAWTRQQKFHLDTAYIAYSDAPPPGIRAVTGSIHWSGNIRSFVEIGWPLIQVGQLSVTGEKDVQVLVNLAQEQCSQVN